MLFSIYFMWIFTISSLDHNLPLEIKVLHMNNFASLCLIFGSVTINQSIFSPNRVIISLAPAYILLQCL